MTKIEKQITEMLEKYKLSWNKLTLIEKKLALELSAWLSVIQHSSLSEKDIKSLIDKCNVLFRCEPVFDYTLTI